MRDAVLDRARSRNGADPGNDGEKPMVLDEASVEWARDAFEVIPALMDLLPVGILIVEGDSISSARLARCNAVCAKLFGTCPEPGKRPTELEYAYYRQRNELLPYAEWPSIRALVTGKTVHEQALHVRRADGSWRVLTASAAPLRRAGRIQGAVVVYQDATAQHELERAILRGEERYARLAATVPGVLYEFEPRPNGGGRFTYLSPRCRDLLEVDARAIVDDGDVLRRMVRPEDAGAFQQELLGECLSGEPWDRTVRIVTPSGKEKCIELLSLPCPAAPGQHATRSGLMLDVTERQRADEELREAQGWLNLSLEATEAGTLHAVPYGPAVVSPRFMEMFGITDPDAIPDFEAFLRLLHREDQDRIRQIVERALDPAVGGFRDIRYRCVWPDGTVRWIAASGKSEFAGTGAARRAVRLAVVTLDITDRKREEDALRESEERFRMLADNIPQQAFIADRQGEITWVNRRSLEFSGQRLTGRGYLLTVHPDHRERVTAQFEHCLETGDAFEDTTPMQDKAGRYRWFLTRVVALRDLAGAVVRWFGTNTDVTELREAQEALREADQRKTHFLAVLSHELRNPLAPIRNSLYLLRRSALESEQAARALDVIDRQTVHLTRLVDDLLDTTRISHDKMELRREPLDLRDVVRRTCDDHQATFEHHGVRLRFDDPGPLWVEADATRIAQAVGNLLQNAAKFTPRGGDTFVSLGIEGGRAVIRVRDNGAGMEPADVERMFAPFEQADSSLARPHGGLGLGLALAKRVIELHGGSVEGRSEGLGRGSEFTISLPLCAQHPPGEADSAPAAGTGRLVLIIEDNVDAGETLAEVLRVGGHRVHLALDGLTGIAEARRLVPDVVVCDIGLPDVDGYEVARTLRADASLRCTRLVAVTGYAQAEDCDRARVAGFDAHLAKPASIGELEKVIVPRP